METASIPEDWKLANVTAIHKKGNRQDPGNYRPISLTSVVGKTMERLTKDKLVDYLERNKLIIDSQHGLRHGRSCLTNLLDFFGEVISTYDEYKAVDVVDVVVSIRQSTTSKTVTENPIIRNWWKCYRVATGLAHRQKTASVSEQH